MKGNNQIKPEIRQSVELANLIIAQAMDDSGLEREIEINAELWEPLNERMEYNETENDIETS